MVTGRFTKLEAQEQAKLLAPAEEEFAEQGFFEASINRIIDRCPVSRGTFYKYFEDKLDVFLVVLTRQLVRFARHAQVPPTARTPRAFWSEVHKMNTKGVEFARQNARVSKLLHEGVRIAQLHEDREDAAALLTAVRGFVRGLITHGQQIGAVRTDEDVELLIDLVLAVRNALDSRLMYGPKPSSQTVDALAKLYTETHRRLLGVSRR